MICRGSDIVVDRHANQSERCPAVGRIADWRTEPNVVRITKMKMKKGRRRKRRIGRRRVRPTHLSFDLPLESFFERSTL
jgi:hypothetical protein